MFTVFFNLFNIINSVSYTLKWLMQKFELMQKYNESLVYLTCCKAWQKEVPASSVSLVT